MDEEPKITIGILIVGLSPIVLLTLYLLAWTLS